VALPGATGAGNAAAKTRPAPRPRPARHLSVHPPDPYSGFAVAPDETTRFQGMPVSETRVLSHR
jgi:hypothetical protein